MSKYDPFRDMLLQIPPNVSEKTLMFSEIESILGFKLPESAYNHRAWWANPSSANDHPYAQAWLAAGWKVESVNQSQKWVRFLSVASSKRYSKTPDKTPDRIPTDPLPQITRRSMSQICHQLHQLFNHLPVLAFPFDTNMIPQNGIYILFETVETGHGTNRIVRIGTHTGSDQLRSRLKQHYIQENKDRSIFRKNIGRAILNRDHDPFLAQWELDLTTHEAKQKYKNVVDYSKQKLVEQQVTKYIQGNFRFIVFCVNEKDKRLDWESKIISTVSLCTECHPSSNWLGKYSPKEKIRQSGLWIVNELYKKPLSDGEYNELEKAIIDK